ncbi:MAG: copper chaperone PCu(A)C [Alphaproteobacteria bacterium]|nr:copper chaperone PCu(A)C [Alphaproteobacteria bacterium]
MRLALLFLAATCMAAAGQVHADTALLLVASDARLVLGPPTINVHAGYLEVRNPGRTEIIIESVSSDAHRRVHIHRSKIIDGIATMEPVDRLPVEPGAAVVFEPGALHLMLTGPTRTITEGDKVVIQLKLSDQRLVPVTMRASRTAQPAHGHAGHSSHAH